MAATLQNLIVKGCSIAFDGNASDCFKNKLNIIAAHFSTLKGFKNASIDSFNNLKSVEGDKCFRKLSSKEATAIASFQNEIVVDWSIGQNFIKILTKNFVSKQIAMISAISIESLNANPILCVALNLKTPEEFVRFSAYQAIGRSIVTSMGYLVEDLLLYSNEDIYNGKNFKEGDKTKFDLVIDRLGEVKSFLEIKSGFNDMDAAQVKHYADEIKHVEEKGYRGFIGITYGKKDDKTVTSSLLKKYLPNWEDKTLVGKELWDFVSEEENYHTLLIESIDSVANSTLQNVSIVQKIEDRIEEVIKEFYSKFNSLREYYESLW